MPSDSPAMQTRKRIDALLKKIDDTIAGYIAHREKITESTGGTE